MSNNKRTARLCVSKLQPRSAQRSQMLLLYHRRRRPVTVIRLARACHTMTTLLHKLWQGTFLVHILLNFYVSLFRTFVRTFQNPISQQFSREFITSASSSLGSPLSDVRCGHQSQLPREIEREKEIERTESLNTYINWITEYIHHTFALFSIPENNKQLTETKITMERRRRKSRPSRSHVHICQ